MRVQPRKHPPHRGISGPSGCSLVAKVAPTFSPISAQSWSTTGTASLRAQTFSQETFSSTSDAVMGWWGSGLSKPVVRPDGFCLAMFPPTAATMRGTRGRDGDV